MRYRFYARAGLAPGFIRARLLSLIAGRESMRLNTPAWDAGRSTHVRDIHHACGSPVQGQSGFSRWAVRARVAIKTLLGEYYE